jgi:hypothetical protein
MNGVILSSYFTEKIHPNDRNDPSIVGRLANGYVKKNDFSYIENWYNSIIKNNLNAVLFYDGLSKDFVEKYQTDKIKFIKVGSFIYSNNDYRFFCFRNYLEDNKFDYVFHTDASDVVVVQSPEKLLKDLNGYSYYTCKDSIKLNQFPYINIHEQLRWDDKLKFLLNQNNWDLINMGVVGGRYEDMLLFYQKFCEIRIKMGNPDFNSDMWILQYLLRSILADKKFIMGDPVCSEFKKYEKERKDVFFIHK